MAGSSATVTFGKINTPYAGTHGLVKVEIDWVADDTNGSVPETDFDATDTIDILGRYCSLGVTDPGTTAPTADYDIEILDEYGCDIFGGNMTNRSATVSEQTLPIINNGIGSRLCAGILTFKLTNNSVNDAIGKCVLYFEI
jgi:hypothetical protein